MKLFATLVAFGLLASTGAATFAQTLPDPTGTWTGMGSCKGLRESAKFKAKGGALLRLTHTDVNQLSAELQIANTETSFLLELVGCGFVAAESGDSSTGRAVIHGLSTAAVFDDFYTGNVTNLRVFPLNNGTSGTLKAVFTVADKSQDMVLTCKVSLERTDDADPGLSYCGEICPK